ncbi:MAG: Ig-like domain-containing protein [Syntrophotaleaceae bacterium]
MVDGNYVLNWSLPAGTSQVPSGGYDIWIDGQDSATKWRTTGTSQTISGLDPNVRHTFSVEARWYQVNPAQFPRSTTVTVETATAHPAPVLHSVKLENGKYLLDWSMPNNPDGTPAGGYDIWINGHDTNTVYRTTDTSQTISGLDINKIQAFTIEARWTQTSPVVFPQSEAVTVHAQGADAPPTAAITSPAAGTALNRAQTLTIVAAAKDNTGVTKVEFYDGTSLLGTDTTSPYSVSIPITAANNGTHSLTALAHDQAGNSTRSTAVPVTVNIADAKPCPAPQLQTAKLENGTYVLSWTMPNNPAGTPAGGYDIWIDGHDTNTAYRTTGTSHTIRGLNTSAKHSFVIEARWTQMNPVEFPQSNALSVAAAAMPDSDTTAGGTKNPVISGPVKIFPGAQGFGTDSKAGRGGKIIKVTNLNDSGSGSLRAALEASGPRIVVFEVGGTIHLNSNLRIRNPYCTVAGQTAPGQGIMIRGYGLSITTNDVLVQHLAIRVGDEVATSPPDGVQILKPSYNVVIDHCSISWGVDENADTWTDVRDVTFSNNIISECLRYSVHTDGKHSKGYLAGRRNKNIAFIGNLQAHNETRNPMVYGRTEILIVNNVFYNAGAYSFCSIGDGWGDGPPKATVVGNVFRKGPGTTAPAAIKIESSSPSGTAVHETANYYDGGKVQSGSTGYFTSAPPVSLSGIKYLTKENDILNSVLTNAGARPAKRDAVDNRIANPSTGEVVNKKGSWVDSVDGNGTRAPGGWPNYPDAYRAFDEGTNPNGDDNGNGYTNIEEKLYQMAVQVGQK